MSKKRKKIKGFDYASHNRKIAQLRGQSWKRALKLKKLEADKNPSALKYERVKKDLSQNDVRKKLGFGDVAIYARIERREKTTNKDRAKEISKILKVPVSKVFVKVDNNRYFAI